MTISFENFYVIDHPLIQHKLSLMRKKTTGKQEFRALLKQIAQLMGFEITRDLPLTKAKISTPICEMDAPVIDDESIAIVPILRAGLGMADGLLELMPEAYEGHIGMYRDPVTKYPVEYLVKLPKPDNRLFILVDPMLATGHSAVAAVETLIKHGVKPEKIKFMALVASPEGVGVFKKSYPDITLYTAALDEKLNEHAYIVPGLGDAGDRLFGTL